MTSFFCNRVFDKGELKRLIHWFLISQGAPKTLQMVDQLKSLGFHYATQAGISLGIEDLKIPPIKTRLLLNAEDEVNKNDIRFDRAQVTAVERSQKVIDIWNTTNELLKDEVVHHFRSTDLLNPVYMMAFSGARGNISQVRQLVGMRGLMSDPQGEIIDLPIKSNFREGLTVTEYIISCYGARKGLVDTALKTANSGYLTRRLVDVAQAVIVNEVNCNTLDGLVVNNLLDRTKVVLSREKRLIGRVLAEDVYDLHTRKIIGFKNQDISPHFARKLNQVKAASISVRSPLTCQTSQHVCQLCYGWSLAQGQLVDLGEAVGIIAAQSIGEPGTQLTMRTFHTGGVFSGQVVERVYAPHTGIISYNIPNSIKGKTGLISSKTSSSQKGKSGLISYKTNSSQKGKSGLISYKTNLIQKAKTRTIFGQEVLFWTEDIEVFIKSDKNETTVLCLPPYTLLFTNPNEKVYSKQIIAEYSTLEQIQQKVDDPNAVMAIKEVSSDITGQAYFQFLPKLEKPLGALTGNVGNQGSGLLWVLGSQIKAFSSFKQSLVQKGDFIHPSKGEVSKNKVLVNKSESLVTDSSFKHNVLSNGFLYKESSLYKPNNYSLLWSPIGTKSTPFSSEFGYLLEDFEQSNYSKMEKYLNGKSNRSYNLRNKLSTRRKLNALSSSSVRFFKSTFETKCTSENRVLFSSYCSSKEYNLYSSTSRLVDTFPSWFYRPKQNKKVLRVKELKNQFLKNYSINRPYEKILDDISFNEAVFSTWYESLNSFSFRKLVPFSTNQSGGKFTLEQTCSHFFIPAGTPLVQSVFKSGDQLKQNELGLFQQKKHDLSEVVCLNPNGQVLLKEKLDQVRLSLNPQLNQISFVKTGSLVLKGDSIAKGIKSTHSGIVIQSTKDLIILRTGRPYRTSTSSSIVVSNNSIVLKGKTLFSLAYKKSKTGDIVQGLPKIEELLEARRTKDLQPIVNNPHDRLKRQFTYEQLYLNTENALKKSLLDIQQFLVDGVQSVYQSQGVDISDKHVEIIVKQMTSKVFIEDGGQTPFLHGDLVDLYQLKKINDKAANKGEKVAKYEPIILGITKASLKAESFISAASFQETTRVLTQAAIQGKFDYFMGLKENVVVGQLIPAGTGFLRTNGSALFQPSSSN
jgi:hypothetical protein